MLNVGHNDIDILTTQIIEHILEVHTLIDLKKKESLRAHVGVTCKPTLYYIYHSRKLNLILIFFINLTK